MSLGQDIAAALPGLRAAAESMMTDTVIGVSVAQGEMDPETGIVPDVETPVYQGAARLRFGSAQGRDADFQGDSTTTVIGTLSLPVDGSADVKVGAVFTVQSSQFNPDNVGTQVRVTGVQPTTYATARRFQVDHYS